MYKINGARETRALYCSSIYKNEIAKSFVQKLNAAVNKNFLSKICIMYCVI